MPSAESQLIAKTTNSNFSTYTVPFANFCARVLSATTSRAKKELLIV